MSRADRYGRPPGRMAEVAGRTPSRATLSPRGGGSTYRRWGNPHLYALRRTSVRDLGPIPGTAPASSVEP